MYVCVSLTCEMEASDIFVFIPDVKSEGVGNVCMTCEMKARHISMCTSDVLSKVWDICVCMSDV